MTGPALTPWRWTLAERSLSRPSGVRDADVGLDEWSAALVSGIDMTAVNVAAGTPRGRDLRPWPSCVLTGRLVPVHKRAAAAVRCQCGHCLDRRGDVRRRNLAGGGTNSSRAPFRPPLPTLPAGPFGDGFKDGANGDAESRSLLAQRLAAREARRRARDPVLRDVLLGRAHQGALERAPPEGLSHRVAREESRVKLFLACLLAAAGTGAVVAAPPAWRGARTDTVVEVRPGDRIRVVGAPVGCRVVLFGSSAAESSSIVDGPES